jgi:hypothetical protein
MGRGHTNDRRGFGGPRRIASAENRFILGAVTRTTLTLTMVVSLLAACGGPERLNDASDASALVGTLDPATLPAQPVVFGRDGLHAYGLTEVPAGSRLQAAYVMADAQARAELARLVEVRITSTLSALFKEDSTEVRRTCLERARASLPGMAATAHGARSSADGRTLSVAARIDVPAEVVRAWLAPAFAAAPEAAALDAAVTHLLETP